MMRAGKLIRALAAPFQTEGEPDIPLLLAFIFINLLVLANAARHDPTIGYDSLNHLHYIAAFSNPHWVTPKESYEFFSPPLPYLFPAALIAGTGMSLIAAVKFAQFLNVLLSIGLIYYLIRICRLMSPRRIVALGAVLFLGILPVYYKSFAFVRGEPYVAFFAVAGTFYFLKIFVRNEYTWPNTIAAGASLGCCILSRQWGILLVPAISIFAAGQWFRQKQHRLVIFNALAISLAIAFLLSGWFYIGLKQKYGSFTAFNRKPKDALSFSNQPSSFYTGISPGLLFSKPVRPNFANQLIPIFYSETWGDYWGIFLLFSQDLRKPNDSRLNDFLGSQLKLLDDPPSWMVTNYQAMGAYLGRVNLVSIFPSLLALLALATAVHETFRRKTSRSSKPLTDEAARSLPLLLLAVAFACAGYFWFLVLYPSLGKGDTIKATYLLHIFPFIAVLVGLLLEKMEQRSRLIPRFVIGGLLLVVIHNFPAMVTHYPMPLFR